ncbi:MAG TPA: YciI family protein [Streptosporangiaceae bacterium]|jgi:hypothetical protein|nr:YciI family protein [Streptosporangiaceae bacterium]
MQTLEAWDAEMIARAILTDGPFAETKEQIAGYSVLECASPDEAIAGRWCRRAGRPPAWSSISGTRSGTGSSAR